MIAKMGRGINLGNTLSAPVEGNWQPPVTESYFEDITAVGFTTVRIPTDFFGYRTSGNTTVYSKAAGTAASYTGNPSDYVVNSDYFDRIEQVVTWALGQGLVVVLDFHGSDLKDEFLQTFSPKAQYAAYYTDPTSAKRVADNEKFRAIWTQIAERFKNYSFDLLFEVVNEPYFFLKESEMDALNTDIISIIRASGSNNTDRNIIITGGGKNSFEAPQQIGNSILSMDDNLIATFHYYLPRVFTASSQLEYNDFDWGTTADKETIDADFNSVLTWSQFKNIPVLLGEFGADNECGYQYDLEQCGLYGGPDKESRITYHKYLADAAIKRGFAFTVWDAGHKSNKTIYLAPNRSWVTEIKDAVLDKTLSVAHINNRSSQTTIYPNPTNERIYVQSLKKISRIRVFDVSGSEKKVSFTQDYILVNEMSNGMYVLNICYDDGSTQVKKILISNN